MVDANLDTEILGLEQRSSNNQSMLRDESRSILTRSNIGATSMQKLTGVASKAQLLPQADLMNEVSVSQFDFVTPSCLGTAPGKQD